MSKLLKMLSMSSYAFPLMLNPDPEASGGASTEATPPATATPPVSITEDSLSFIPEAYRQDPSISKYKSADDLFKGFQNLQKLVGQKQIVQGLQLPGDDASEEDVSKFYQSLGRPEAADKYELPSEVELPEGYNIEEVKGNFTKLAHKNNITQKQAAGLFKDFIGLEKQNFIESQKTAQVNFDQAVLKAFGAEFKPHLDMAKKGAKSLPDGHNIALEDLKDPLTLKVLAKLGEYVGEDSFIDGGSSENGESLKEEALRLQKSAGYQNGSDPVALRRVEEIYKTLYPTKK